MQTARVLLGTPHVPDAVQLCRWLCAGVRDDALPLKSTGSEALGLTAWYTADDDFDRQLATLAKVLEVPTVAGGAQR